MVEMLTQVTIPDHIERDSRGTKIMAQIKVVAYSLVGLLVIIGLWAAAVPLFDVKEYILPTPLTVWHSIVDNRSMLWDGTKVTGKEVVYGFLLATLIGIPIGILLGESKVANRVFYPVLVIGQIIPKVAIGPLMVVWFGLGLESKLIFVVLMSFFPLVLNTMVGVSSASSDFRRLARSVGLSRTRTLTTVTLPQAMPNIFAGLKLAMTLAVIAAVVAEFITSQAGLGFMILTAQGQIDTPLLFASVVVLTVMGLVLYALINVIEFTILNSMGGREASR